MASSKSAALFADDTKCYRSIESMEDGASTTLTSGVISAWQVDLNQSKCGLLSITRNATTSCKNVKTLPRKNDLSCFKSLLITGLWDIILTSLLPFIQSCSSKFWVWPCIASNFDKGWRGDTSTRSWTGHLWQNTVVSQVLLQLVVAHFTSPINYPMSKLRRVKLRSTLGF